MRHGEVLSGAMRSFGGADLSIDFGELDLIFLIYLLHNSRFIYTKRV